MAAAKRFAARLERHLAKVRARDPQTFALMLLIESGRL